MADADLSKVVIKGLAAIIVCVLVYFFLQNVKQQRDAAERDADAAKREAEREAQAAMERKYREAQKVIEQKYREAQDAYRRQMSALGETALVLFEAIPKQVGEAEGDLTQAEAAFADRAFAPFWDCVEKAARTLSRVDENVRAITGTASRYAEIATQVKENAPVFPVRIPSIEKLSAGTMTAERMMTIVRQAQSDFQFAVIFEQRKTNQILVAGFTNLGQALEQMTWRITNSIGGLASAVDTMGATLNDSVSALDEQVRASADATASYRETRASEAAERTKREEKVVEMLDNIQRARRPWP
jgi:hypothetical protein